MAGKRNPFLRTLGIVGNTVVDIGKDYTSNFQTLVTDADQIKQSVMQVGGNAKDTFERMRHGSGPIKGFLDWFYTKEGETDMYDLDGGDTDFDAGFESSSDDEDGENKGPGILDTSSMKDIARGQVNAMYKIAHKIAETQVANTSEIVSTINNRTAEIVAATNNINTTLLGISKKLDAVTNYVNARGFEMKRERSEGDPLYDFNGRLTLGSVFNASKASAQNSTAASVFSLLNTMRTGGMLTPETVARLGFDFFVGDKERKWLGDQSINEVGNKINDAIGQGISDALEKVINTKTFKGIFGDLNRENRDTTFRSDLKNEYTREPAVFDGMTRTSIIKTIPEYLNKIYQKLSGEKLYVSQEGQLTTKNTNTFENLVAKELFGKRGVVDYDDMNKFTKSQSRKGGGMTSAIANKMNAGVTAWTVIFMMNNGIIRPNKDWISPMNVGFVDLVSRGLFEGTDGSTSIEMWKTYVTDFLIYLKSEPGAMTKFINGVTERYQDIMRNMKRGAPNVSDTWNVGQIDASMGMSAARLYNQQQIQAAEQRKKLEDQRKAANANIPGIDTIGSGDGVPRIVGRGEAEDIEYRSLNDNISDIRAMIAAQTKKIIGNKSFRGLHLSKAVETPQMDDLPVTFSFDEPVKKEEKPKTQQEIIKDLKNNASYQGIKEGAKDIFGALGEGIKSGFTGIVDSTKKDGQSNKLSDAMGKAGDVAGDLLSDAGSAVKSGARKGKDAITGALERKLNKQSKDADDDRNTVSMISAFMQTAIQNGSVTQDEKNSLTKMIDSLNDPDLKNKLRTSVNAMLERASVKVEESDKKGKSTFSLLKLLLSPVKTIANWTRYLVPTLLKGIGAFFAPEMKQIREGVKGIGQGFKGVFSGIGEGISNKWNARKGKKERQMMADEASDEINAIYEENKKEKSGLRGGFAAAFDDEPAVTKVSVEGIDEQGTGYMAKLLTKIYGLFKGDEESVLSEIAENTEEKKISNNDTDETSGGFPWGTNAENSVGSVKGMTFTTGGTAGSVTPGTQGFTDANGKVATAIGTVFNTGGEGATNALGGFAMNNAANAVSSFAGGGAAGAIGTAAKSVSAIFKIGKSLGTIVKSLGGIGLAVGKIVLKTIMMMSGFKAIIKTFKEFKASIGKAFKMLLKPLNKVFKFINNTIKPILNAVSEVISKIAESLGGLLDQVLDVVVPLLEDVVEPVLNALMPAFDTIIDVLNPLFDVISGMVDVILTPLSGELRFILIPGVQRIGYAVETITGLLEVAFGKLMVPVGTASAGIGYLIQGVGKIIKGMTFGAFGKAMDEKGEQIVDAGGDMTVEGIDMVEDGLKHIKSGIKGFVTTTAKQWVGIVDEDTKSTEDKYIKNPNAADPVAPGSVLDVSGSGDSHDTIWNISNIYGSGNSQKSYGNTLNMSANGCGPMALADAYNRRNGAKVDGLNLANSMARGGSYEPNKGTSVASFMGAADSLGMNMRAGGVTRDSLKYASPNNPVTVIGSGSDFGTRSGNNHYMNVIGTDRYGGAYVSNPLTGRVDRRSASTIAASSVMGLYGSGDSSDLYTFPDAVSDALKSLKDLAGSMLGLFTGKSKADEMEDNLNKIKKDLAGEEMAKTYDDENGDGSYAQLLLDAKNTAYTDFKASNPRMPGETENAYLIRFNKWYTDDKRAQYVVQSEAWQQFQEKYTDYDNNGLLTSIDLKSIYETDADGNYVLDENGNKVKKKKASWLTALIDTDTGSDGGDGSSTIFSDSGVPLYTPYEPKVLETNITGDGTAMKSESPLHEFFSMTSGGKENTSVSWDTSWYKHYNAPVTKEGVGNSGGDHHGIDFNWTTGSNGKPLYTTTAGEVVQSKTAAETTAGNSIMWKDPAGYYHWYMHMLDAPLLKEGDKFDGGTQVGYVGNTGKSNGAHLHYSISSKKPGWESECDINPLMYFNKHRNTELVGSTDAEKVFAALVNNGMSRVGAAGIMGCFQEESGMNSNNLENSWQSRFGYPDGNPGDVQYTNEVNNGTESENDFVHGRGNTNLVGYGLGQFTTDGKKQDLYNRTVAKGKSVDDIGEQIAMTLAQLKSYGLFDTISGQTDPKEANNIFMRKYEAGTAFNSDADVLRAYSWLSQADLDKRRNNAQSFYDTYKDWTWDSKNPTSPTGYKTTNNNFGQGNSASDGKMWENYNAIGNSSGKNTGTVHTDGGDLYLRASWSTNSAIVDQIPNGTKLDLEYDGHYDTDGSGHIARYWYKTSYNGKSGYVASDYIQLDETDKDFAEKNSVTPTIVQNPNQDILGGIQGSSGGNTTPSALTTASNLLNGIDLGSNITTTTTGANTTTTTKAPTTASDVVPWYGRKDQLNPTSASDAYKAAHNKTRKTKLPTYARKNVLDPYTPKPGFEYLVGEDQSIKDAGSTLKDLAKQVAGNAVGFDNIWASGDGIENLSNALSNNVSDLGGFANVMNILTGNAPDTFDSTSPIVTPADIPELDSSVYAEDQATGNSYTVNKISVQSNNKLWDARIQAILKNTYKVRAERVEQLLEQIIDRMDNAKSDKPTTSDHDVSLFNDDTIPQSVQRLIRG